MKLTKKTNRKIDVTNYILITFIFIMIMIGTLIIRNLYVARINDKLNTSVLNDVLINKLNVEELDNYLLENNDVILFITIIDDDNSRKLEKSVKSYINKNNLNEEIKYLPIDRSSLNSFIDTFNQKYVGEEKLEDCPVLVYFNSKKVINMIQGDIDVNDFKEFVEEIRDDK